MKIHKGNIFDAEWNGMVHCCNWYHTMGAGIAEQVKRLYPAAWLADQATPYGSCKLGDFSYCKSENIRKTFFVEIFNLYAQKGIGNHGDPLQRNIQYDHLLDGMIRICNHIMFTKDAEIIYNLAMPEIGCGLAGGNPKIVYSILEYVESMFPNIEFNIYVL